MIRRSIYVETAWRPEFAARDIYILSEGWCPQPNHEDMASPGAKFIAKPMEFEPIDRASIAGPTLRLPGEIDKEFMQSMMDAAWEMGLRPSGVKDLELTLDATRYHLEDMRLLAKVCKAK